MKLIIYKEGYVYVFVNGHPYSHKGYVAYHRLVVESFIGRYLNEEESVHHINGNKRDNRISNLFLFKTYKEHKRFEVMVKNLGLDNPIIIKKIKDRWKPYLQPIIRTQ